MDDEDVSDGVRFVCFACSYPLTSKERLMEHVERSHKDGYLYKCPTCFSCFINKSMLLGHMINVHNRVWDNYKCKYCKFKSNKYKRMLTHIYKQHKSPHTDKKPKGTGPFLSWKKYREKLASEVPKKKRVSALDQNYMQKSKITESLSFSAHCPFI